MERQATPSTPLTLQTSSRWLEVRLTEEERKQRADRAAELSALSVKDELREEQYKAEAKSAKEAKESKQKEAGALLAVYRAGKESQNVECREEYDGIEVLVVRTDTEAVIEKRRPNEQDWKRIRDAQQTRLAFNRAGQALEDLKKQSVGAGVSEEKTPPPASPLETQAAPKGKKAPAKGAA